MADRDGAVECRDKLREAKAAEKQVQDTHKDGQGTGMKYQTPR